MKRFVASIKQANLLTTGTLVFMMVLSARAVSPVPEKILPAIPDKQAFTIPDHVQLTGWVGSRISVNEANRLVKLDPARLLEGYRKRPGRQAWDGEHVGKWLHAATLAWVYTGDPVLRQKLDYIAIELAKCQLDDGYLGTYLEKDRWTEWDVWAHKYNLIGLITYMRYTGNLAPLPTCRRMADLLCNTFGDEPGKRDILKAGWHVGMAPTSVLEPMVLLYRLTGEPRYLDFCKYILRAWEQPNGPKIVSTLLTAKRVDKVGNGKAYEMLSCLNGALEYYRTVGDSASDVFRACLNAWQDIVEHRLYITGAASYGELFHGDYDLPNVDHVGETCVTVTWLQFNAQLLRLTGEARFAEQLEHVVLNQLFGAQKCDGSGWGYYVEMEGKKPYSSTLDGHCCLSSGPRGIALIPTFALTTDGDGLVVNLYDAGTAELALADGTPVKLTLDTVYPANGRVRLKVEPAAPANFTVKLRSPAWCQKPGLRVAGKRLSVNLDEDGYLAIKRTWKPGDEIELSFQLTTRIVLGDHKNQGKIAVLHGPLVLAADEALLPEKPEMSLGALAAAGATPAALHITPEAAPDKVRTWPGEQVFRMNAVTRRTTGSLKPGTRFVTRLVPFADAGGTGSPYKVWLPLPRSQSSGNLLLDARESRSRQGNVNGSITDNDPQTLVVTFNAKPAAEDWFAVNTEGPITVRRILYVHGKTFHDGGWFDTTGGKPQIQIKRTVEGRWETVATLDTYPAATATDAAGLQGGEGFERVFPEPLKAFAIRILGKPASGDNPKQAFSSCAELQAFEK